MAHWLMKSEPNVFGWDDLVAKDKRGEVEQWHGVRNFTARNNMMKMALGDQAFFYHSNIGKEIVGIMKVVALAHPDSTAELSPKGKPVWFCVDVSPVKPFKRPVTLDEIKAEPKLSEMSLIRYSRLSVQPVTDAEWALICRMGGL
jgi:predicted RNA-binding protein with PUA-like domain